MDKEVIKERLENNKKALKCLDRLYFKAFSPAGYKTGTSYNDYDTIRGSRKELRILEYYEERKRLLALIELDEGLLKKVNIIDVNEDEYIKELDKREDKIRFLREVKKYTQKDVAKKLGISEQTVRRIERGKISKDE